MGSLQQKWSRHLKLSDFSHDSIQLLQSSHVGVVGCGGLGSIVAISLAASGIGHLTLIDPDTVDISNLHRQLAFTTHDIGLPKATVLSKACTDRNPSCNVTPLTCKFKQDMDTFDVVTFDDVNVMIDCTDNAPSRMELYDWCVKHNKCYLFGSAIGWDGQVFISKPSEEHARKNCLRCMFPQFTQSTDRCDGAGVFGLIPNIIGCVQSSLCIRYLLNLPTSNSLECYSGKTDMWFSLTTSSCTCTCRDDTSSSLITSEVTYDTYCTLHKEDPSNHVCIDIDEDEEEIVYGVLRMNAEACIARIIEEDARVQFYILCKYGHKSGNLAMELGIKGHKNVHNIKGGKQAIFH